MKLTLSAGLCAPLFAGASLIGGYAQAASSLADVITSAVADPARPEGDRNRDVARQPVESLQFSGIKPGDAVADFNASAGYFTRLFSDVVGSRGHVYAIEPVEIQQYIAKSTAELRGYADYQPLGEELESFDADSGRHGIGHNHLCLLSLRRSFADTHADTRRARRATRL